MDLTRNNLTTINFEAFNMFNLGSGGGGGVEGPKLVKEVMTMSTTLGTTLPQKVISCSCSMQGFRKSMEDDYVMTMNLRGQSPPPEVEKTDEDSGSMSPTLPSRKIRKDRISRGKGRSQGSKNFGRSSAMKPPSPLPFSPHNDFFLSVFDGHGGPEVSSHIAQKIVDKYLQSSYMSSYSEGKDPGSVEVEVVGEALKNVYLELDRELKEECMRESNVMKRKQFDAIGSTGISAYVTGSEIATAGLGDSRIILCKKGEIIQLTKDHKPNNLEETARIVQAGGTVRRGRINGQLAVSRSFGDFFYKGDETKDQLSQMISPAPEVGVYKRDLENDQFMILACDGVWDVITNKDACYFVGELLAEGIELERICKKLLDYCLLANSKDNMTIIICVFPGAEQLEMGAFKNAEGFKQAIEVKPDLAALSSQTQQSRNVPGRLGTDSKRHSLQLFSELQVDDGLTKIALRAASHSDELIKITKDVILTWNGQEVVDNFLKVCELDCYTENFLQEGVDGKLLLELTQSECQDDLLMNTLDARFLVMTTTFLNSSL